MSQDNQKENKMQNQILDTLIAKLQVELEAARLALEASLNGFTALPLENAESALDRFDKALRMLDRAETIKIQTLNQENDVKDQ